MVHDMKDTVEILGVQDVIKNLKKENATVREQLRQGLSMTGQYIKRKSQQIVPVATDNLKGTAFTRVSPKGYKDINVTVGYSGEAEYGIYVHENPKAKHKPGKRYKFLEHAVTENVQEILRILQRNIRL